MGVLAMLLLFLLPGGGAADTGVVRTVVNADGGVYWRTATPDWNNPIRNPGYGVYNGDNIELLCWTLGSTVPPYNNNTLWYNARIVSGRGLGTGFVNDHFIYTGINEPNIVEPGVPRCGSSPPPPPPVPASQPTVTLSQGPVAPSGYRYAISLTGFPAFSSIQVACYDTASPSGFWFFPMQADSGGSAYTQSECYSGDGPDHWVRAGGFESNHVSWGSPPSPSVPTPQPAPRPTPSPSPTIAHPPVQPEQCLSFNGDRIADSGSVWYSLYDHALWGGGRSVVIDWSFFAKNPSFVARARQLPVGQQTVYFENLNTDMGRALAHFSVKRTSASCYWVYDRYDFAFIEFPFWVYQLVGSVQPFDVNASGRL